MVIVNWLESHGTTATAHLAVAMAATAFYVADRQQDRIRRLQTQVRRLEERVSEYDERNIASDASHASRRQD